MKMYKRIALAFALWVASISAVLGQAALLPDGKQQYFDNNGNPLAAGTINFYIPATTTPKTTWQDAAQTTPNTNPVVLDSAGRAIIYGAGVYRMLVKDSLGNTIFDALTTGQSQTGIIGGATAGGSANAKTLTLSGYTNTNGAAFCFINNTLNTGAVTMNINSQGAVALRSSIVPGDLTSGAVIANYYYCAVYNSSLTQYDLINAPSLVNPATVATTGVTTIPTTAGNGVTYTGDATSATYAITLPSAATWGAGKMLTVQKIDSSTNTVRVTPAGGDLIDIIYDRVDLWSQGDMIRLQSTGTGWISLARNIKTYSELVVATNTSYAPKRGVRQIRIVMIGGGGGGGSSGGCVTATRACGGSGGGSGQTWDVRFDWQKLLINTPAANTLSLTVGGGGASNTAGAASVLSWNAGAMSYTAKGGNGGGGGVDTGVAMLFTLPSGGQTQLAPTSVAGTIIANWWTQSNNGGFGGSSGSSVGSGFGGWGGFSQFGGGGNSTRTDSAGAAADAQSYGAGGGGGVSLAAAADRAGGVGTSGAFLVEQFY